MLTSVVIGRTLGPAGRGEIAAALLWPVLLTVIFSTGMIPAVLYFSSASRQDADKAVPTALSIGAIQSVLAMTAGYFALPLLLHSQSDAVVSLSRFYLLVIPLLLFTNFGWSFLQARLRLTAFNALRLVTPLGYLGGAAFLAAASRLTVASVIALQLGLASLSFVLTVAAISRTVPVRGKVSIAKGREMLGYGARVQVGDLTRSANVQLDQVLITAWLPAAELGLYSVAVSIGGLTQVIGKAARPVLMAKITNSSDRLAALTHYTTTKRRFFLASGVVVPAMFGIVPFLVPWLYGSSFAPAIAPALILVAASFFLGATELAAGTAQAIGDPWLNSRGELVGFVVTVTALPIAIRAGGITGAAAVSAVAYLVQYVVVARALNRRRSTSAVS